MDGGGDTVEVPNLLQSTALMNMLHMQQLQQQQQGQLQLRPVLPPQMQMQGELVATLKQLHEQHLLNILSQHQGSALAAHRTGSDQQGGQPSRSQGLASHQSVSTFAPPTLRCAPKTCLGGAASLVAGTPPDRLRHFRGAIGSGGEP